jgi:hypothetical protein
MKMGISSFSSSAKADGTRVEAGGIQAHDRAIAAAESVDNIFFSFILIPPYVIFCGQ